MEQKPTVKKVVKRPVVNKHNEKTFITKIKKYWKEILIIVLVIFSFSKCVSSCSRQNKIDNLSQQVEQRDSIITVNGIEMDKLSIKLGDAQESINSYKGIATGNQQELVNKVQSLTAENNELNKKVKKLTKENSDLKLKIKELEEKVNKNE